MRNNQPHGETTAFYKDGTKKEVAVYDDGNQLKPTAFKKDGSKDRECQYKNNKRTECKTFCPLRLQKVWDGRLSRVLGFAVTDVTQGPGFSKTDDAYVIL
jgi:antitoxin component YwqK of YwqJK toxin-antitoxin module